MPALKADAGLGHMTLEKLDMLTSRGSYGR